MPANRPIRVGVVGSGFGRRVVAPAFAAAGCQVVDVVSARDEAAVADLCRGRLDLVSIHSPPFLHAAHVRLAVAHSRAVLCDKPFGRSAGEAQLMLEEAEAAGVIHLVNFEFRHEPARVHVKRLLGDGAIGRVEHLQWSALNAGSRDPLRRHGWLFDRSLGGGWIGAWGSHAVDALRWLLGEVEDVHAVTSVVIAERPDADGLSRPCDAEDTFSAWMTAGGASVAIDTSFAAPLTLPTRVTFLGADGVIEVVNDRHITERRPDGSREVVELSRTEGDVHGTAMNRWAEQVRDAVAAGRQIEPSFADGVACARVLDGLRASAPRIEPSAGDSRP